MDIENKLIELAERMCENTDKQSAVVQSAVDGINKMFKWFCVTLVVISMIYGICGCINSYNRESFDYNKIELTK